MNNDAFPPEPENERRAETAAQEAPVHPATTSVGAAGGGVAGAAIGLAVGGPVGGAIGAAIGAMMGGLGGNAVGEAIESAGAERNPGESGSGESSSASGEGAATAAAIAQVVHAEPSHEETALRAWSLYEREHHPEGRDVDHWLAAESQLRDERRHAASIDPE
jgi:hypothetical protein